MLISIHVPKAGGTSLFQSFRTAYGNRVVGDYSGDPARFTYSGMRPRTEIGGHPMLRPDVAIVHGHFHPFRYHDVPDPTFVTFLRHPVQNLISIYHYWKTLPRNTSAVHDYFLDHALSVTDTARLPVLRRLFSETYFGGFDPTHFHFIGDLATYEADVQRLSDFLGTNLSPRRENVTGALDAESRRAYEEMQNDAKLAVTLTDILLDDVRFYERAQLLPSRRSILARSL